MNYPKKLMAPILLLLAAGCVPGNELRVDHDVPDNLDTLLELAQKSYAADDWLASEKYYLALIERVPIEPENWFRLGNVYARTDRPDAAIAAYREALVRSPDSAKSWHNLGVLYLREAANSFTQMGTHVDPSDPLYDRGQNLYAGIRQLLANKPIIPCRSNMPTDEALGEQSGPQSLPQSAIASPATDTAMDAVEAPRQQDGELP